MKIENIGYTTEKEAWAFREGIEFAESISLKVLDLYFDESKKDDKPWIVSIADSAGQGAFRRELVLSIAMLGGSLEVNKLHKPLNKIRN